MLDFGTVFNMDLDKTAKVNKSAHTATETEKVSDNLQLKYTTFLNINENKAELVSDQNIQISETQIGTDNLLGLRKGQVMANKILPSEFTPVPDVSEADSIYVVNLSRELGFTSQRIQDNRAEQMERIQQIQAVWNQQIVSELWGLAVSAPYMEEEVLAMFGLVIVVRKINLQTNSGDIEEIWDTTVWTEQNGSIKAVQQFLSTQEPLPVKYQSEDGREILAYQLGPDHIIIPHLESNSFELIDLEESEGLISKSILIDERLAL